MSLDPVVDVDTGLHEFLGSVLFVDGRVLLFTLEEEEEGMTVGLDFVLSVTTVMRQISILQ